MRFIIALLCLIISSGAVAAHPKTEIPEKPYPNSRFAVIDSLRIHYRTWNEGAAHCRGKVLLIHGFCGSTFCWRNNFEALAGAGYMVVAVDLPGFGYSARSAKINQSQSNRARMIWELIAAIVPRDTSKWNIVGHSMGGGTAEAVALMNPGRTKSLTIVDGMVFIRNEDVNLSVVGLVNHPVYKKLLLSYTENSYLSFNNFRRTLKGTYGFLPDTLTTMGYWEPLQIDGTAETVVNMLANSDEIQDLNVSGLSQLPVLAIWGKNDRTIRLRTGKKLKRAVPTVELRVIADARHMPMETNPVEFNRIVLEFLNRYNR